MDRRIDGIDGTDENEDEDEDEDEEQDGDQEGMGVVGSQPPNASTARVSECSVFALHMQQQQLSVGMWDGGGWRGISSTRAFARTEALAGLNASPLPTLVPTAQQPPAFPNSHSKSSCASRSLNLSLPEPEPEPGHEPA